MEHRLYLRPFRRVADEGGGILPIRAVSFFELIPQRMSRTLCVQSLRGQT